jgi:hypothetical protein
MRTVVLLTLVLFMPLGAIADVSAAAQSVPSQNGAAQRAPNCRAPEFAQFDFWLGRWEVFNPKGTRAGTNSITRAHGGCVLLESWTGAGGSTGSSFNTYTPATKKWHQVWVDNSGTLLRLEGEFRDGAMRMQGVGLTAKGESMNRITWTPRPDGTVRQLWEVSADKGRTWQVEFDGVYKKVR